MMKQDEELSIKILADILPTEKKVEDLLKQMDQLDWCEPDNGYDGCEAEESLEEALDLVKELGLTLTARTGKKGETLVTFLFDRLKACGHWKGDQAQNTMVKAIKESGVNY